MAWVRRQFSKGDIDKAGNALITLPPSHPNREEALGVINNWRSCHGYPLQTIKMTLLNRARKVDGNALIAQRLKRLPSIALKLQHNPNMKLSQMQDIGGCRAVLANVRDVSKLGMVYEAAKSKNPHDRPVLIEKYDYIACPKTDGYRGIHLVYKYQSKSPEKQDFNGQRIEIQIRSKLQHAWATAVETAQTFTGQALKSKIKSASESWLRFFALMGSANAFWERKPNVPGTPANRKERVEELRQILSQESILDSLEVWNATVHRLEETVHEDAHAFLLVLDPAKRTLRIGSFRVDEVAAAQERYLQVERETENDPQIQVVLVSVDSIDALRRAYPNYYVDTSDFIKVVRREIS
jgi:hypothetical protein